MEPPAQPVVFCSQEEGVSYEIPLWRDISEFAPDTEGGCANDAAGGRGRQGHTGATLIYEEDLAEKGEFSSLDDLEPGMLIFQDTGRFEIRTDRDGKEYTRYLKNHVGMVVMWDFGDGSGMQKAVFHSVTVTLPAGGDKLALFYNDTGPNVTTIGDAWNYYGILK